MAPSRSKPVAGSTKFERPQMFQTLLHNDILQSQQTDTTGDLADTELICDGGCIRVHGFLLQSASPFLQKAMASQGEDYPHMRKILLPDFHVKNIERMLSLVYKGYADLPTDQDVESLKEVLKFFEVSSVDFNLDEDKDCKIVQGSLKVQELNRIPQDIIFRPDVPMSPITSPSVEIKPRTPIAATVKPEKKITKKEKEQPGPSLQTPVRRSSRPQKPVLKLQKAEKDGGDKSDDSDFKANSGDSSDDEPSDSESRPKRGKRPGQQVWKVPSTPNNKVEKPAASASTSSTPSRVEVINKKDGTKDKDNKEEKEDSGTDSEDEDWVKPNFKDKKWFMKESKRCQCCKKNYEEPAKAALCITSHKTLRCYFCFRVYSTTDILFKHFRRRHKQAGREATLICPFCDQAVPFKSVSCHVISVHLSRKELEKQNLLTPLKNSGESSSSTPAKSEPRPGGSRRSRSPSSSVERKSSTERQPQKRLKPGPSSDATGKKPQLKITNLKEIQKALRAKKKEGENGKLQARNLDVTLEKRTVMGNTIKFRIKKSRPVLTNGNGVS